ncbi:transposase family protein (plasmid) [Sinorhizobium sp. B11]
MKLFGEAKLFKKNQEFAPGASSLIRYCREYGEKHFRPFQFFLSNSGGDHKSGRWSNCIKVLKWTMQEWYWSPYAPSDRAVKGWFDGEVAKEKKRRLALELGDEAGDEMRRLMSELPSVEHQGTVAIPEALKIDLASLSKDDEEGANFTEPCPATLQNWIDAGATLENIARREGRTIANRQIEGVYHNAVVTHRPLECVVMDHTQVDMHVVVYDEKGNIKEETYRPWLIVVMDVHSRMVLAANLSIGSPSLQTLYAGLKQTLKPKYFLNHLNLGDAYAWSLDCFGLFKRMLVDNDLANTGRSLRSSAAAIGMRVSFAPVKTPPYKAVVERFFKTLNTNIWHEADGGVREKPGVSKVDPRITARFTIKEAQERLWNWIITVYHLDIHSELGMPPALKWKESLEKYTRPLVKDMRDIDGAFGKSGTRVFTRAGIEYRNEHFYDQDLTTQLLDDLAGLVKGPRGTRELNSTRGFEIDFTEQDTVRALSVFNPARGEYVDYPNRDPMKTGTYEDEVIERQKRNQKVDNFFSRNQLKINVADHLAGLKINPTPVVDVAAESAALAAAGKDGRSSAHNLAAKRRTELVEQRPAARRGSRSATIKAMETRAANKKRTDGTATEIHDDLRPTAPPKKPPVIELRSSSAVAPNPADASENLKTLQTANPFAVGGGGHLDGSETDVDVSLE